MTLLVRVEVETIDLKVLGYLHIAIPGFKLSVHVIPVVLGSLLQEYLLWVDCPILYLSLVLPLRQGCSGLE